MKIMKKGAMSKALELKKTKVIIFAFFLAISIILPAFIHVQWITGPIINAALLLAAVLIGPMEAVLLGLMPPSLPFLCCRMISIVSIIFSVSSDIPRFFKSRIV